MGEQGNNEAILIGRISSGVGLIDLCSFCIGGQKGNNMLACIMPLHESMSSNLPIQKATVKAGGIQSQMTEIIQKTEMWDSKVGNS